MPNPLSPAASLACGLLLAGAVAAVAQAQLASPALDHGLYRRGAIQSSRRQFDRWQLACDQIAALHQRYCSLSTRAFDPRGVPVADITVSTDDHGHPAALIKVAPGLLLPAKVTISAGTGKAHHLLARLRATACDASGCSLVWELPPRAIVDLRKGTTLDLNFRSVPTPKVPAGPLVVRSVAVAATIVATGFNAALMASIR